LETITTLSATPVAKIFARLRSFATNILRFNDVENVSDTRYRITCLDALRSLHFM
jgi:hypothetical protein